MLLYRSSSTKYSTASIKEATFTDMVTGEYYDTSFKRYYERKEYFNSPVIIGNKVFSCERMFLNCNNFNSLVTIGSNVNNCLGMFMYCRNYNQPITIPGNVINCRQMFYWCNNLNQPITIIEGVQDCYGMFYQCSNFNQSLTVPSSVTNLNLFIYGCNDYSNDIYIKGTSYRDIDVKQMVVRNATTQYTPNRINIYFNSVLNSVFNKTDSTSIFGSVVTWALLSNGFYNATQNVYCYYDYSG